MMLRVLAALALVIYAGDAFAENDASGTKADAERAVQGYLEIWSRNNGVTSANVERFYAPNVVYYGKVFSRRQVLADKQAYIRHWPVREYREAPGSFRARCDASRSLCRIQVVMVWRRADGRGHFVSGRARMSFDFVPADGARKIAREAAVNL